MEEYWKSRLYKSLDNDSFKQELACLFEEIANPWRSAQYFLDRLEVSNLSVIQDIPKMIMKDIEESMATADIDNLKSVMVQSLEFVSSESLRPVFLAALAAMTLRFENSSELVANIPPQVKQFLQAKSTSATPDDLLDDLSANSRASLWLAFPKFFQKCLSPCFSVLSSCSTDSLLSLITLDDLLMIHTSKCPNILVPMYFSHRQVEVQANLLSNDLANLFCRSLHPDASLIVSLISPSTKNLFYAFISQFKAISERITNCRVEFATFRNNTLLPSLLSSFIDKYRSSSVKSSRKSVKLLAMTGDSVYGCLIKLLTSSSSSSVGIGSASATVSVNHRSFLASVSISLFGSSLISSLTSSSSSSSSLGDLISSINAVINLEYEMKRDELIKKKAPVEVAVEVVPVVASSSSSSSSVIMMIDNPIAQATNNHHSNGSEPGLSIGELRKLILESIRQLRQIDHELKIFHEPVDENQAKGYFFVIPDPMDISTMYKKTLKMNKKRKFNNDDDDDNDNDVELAAYTSFDEFCDDVSLMYQNCRIFNETSSMYYQAADVQEMQWNRACERLLSGGSTSNGSNKVSSTMEVVDDETSDVISAFHLNSAISSCIEYLKSIDKKEIFLKPVTNVIAPGYFDRISRPMDVLKMKQKCDMIVNHHHHHHNIGKSKKKMMMIKTENIIPYTCFDEFCDDVKLMYQNCRDYNGASSAIAGIADDQEADWKRFVYSLQERFGSRKVVDVQEAAVVVPVLAPVVKVEAIVSSSSSSSSVVLPSKPSPSSKPSPIIIKKSTPVQPLSSSSCRLLTPFDVTSCQVIKTLLRHNLIKETLLSLLCQEVIAAFASGDVGAVCSSASIQGIVDLLLFPTLPPIKLTLDGNDVISPPVAVSCSRQLAVIGEFIPLVGTFLHVIHNAFTSSLSSSSPSSLINWVFWTDYCKMAKSSYRRRFLLFDLWNDLMTSCRLNYGDAGFINELHARIMRMMTNDDMLLCQEFVKSLCVYSLVKGEDYCFYACMALLLPSTFTDHDGDDDRHYQDVNEDDSIFWKALTDAFEHRISSISKLNLSKPPYSQSTRWDGPDYLIEFCLSALVSPLVLVSLLTLCSSSETIVTCSSPRTLQYLRLVYLWCGQGIETVSNLVRTYSISDSTKKPLSINAIIKRSVIPVIGDVVIGESLTRLVSSSSEMKKTILDLIYPSQSSEQQHDDELSLETILNVVCTYSTLFLPDSRSDASCLMKQVRSSIVGIYENAYHSPLVPSIITQSLLEK